MLFTCSYVFDSDSADVFTNVRPVSHFMTLFYTLTACYCSLSLQPFPPDAPQPRLMPRPHLAGLSTALPSPCVRLNLEWRIQLVSNLLTVSCSGVGAFLTLRPNHADTQEPKTSGQSLFVLYRTCKNIWEHVSLVIDSLWGETSGFCRFWLIIMLPNN